MKRCLAILLSVAGWGPCLAGEESNAVHVMGLDEAPKGLARAEWAGIREAYEAGRHAVEATEGGWQARNPGQGWMTRFDGRGFLSTPGKGEWQWGLELRSYGGAGAERKIDGAPRGRSEGHRMTYHWDGGLEEWFVNDGRGLEHGFTIKEEPEGGQGSLRFTLGVRGGLSPVVLEGRRGVSFFDARGQAVVNYAGLKVWDAEGRVLPAQFEPQDSAGVVVIAVEAAGARYPLTVDPVAQQAYLKASNTGAGDNFGWSVAVSGDTVVIGAINEDSAATGVDGNESDELAANAGAAYVFVRNGTMWTQQAYLKASNTKAGDQFGYSVSVDGDTVVVGSYNEASASPGVNGDQASVAAPSSGAVYVFTRSGTVWAQQAYLKASNPGNLDHFGGSVSLFGDTLVAGAWEENSSASGVNGNQVDETMDASGAAYVFTRSGTVWSQQAYLKASNTAAGDRFGLAVGVSGDRVVVGANGEDSSATGVGGNQANEAASGAGAAYVFVRAAGVWSQEAYLKASNTASVAAFGGAVGISGDTVVVGASGVAAGLATNAGNAYVYSRTGGSWGGPVRLAASNAGAQDRFGAAVAVAGNVVVVGAWGEASANGLDGSRDPNDNASPFAGAAYVFLGCDGVWKQDNYVKAYFQRAGDQFGRAVAVFPGGNVVVGAPSEAPRPRGWSRILNWQGGPIPLLRRRARRMFSQRMMAFPSAFRTAQFPWA